MKPWYTLWAHNMTRCPWPTFHAPPTLSKFYVKSRNKVHFSAAVMAVSMKPCIVVVLDTLKHTPWPVFCLTYIARCSYFTKCRCNIDLRGVLVYALLQNKCHTLLRLSEILVEAEAWIQLTDPYELPTVTITVNTVLSLVRVTVISSSFWTDILKQTVYKS